MPDHFLTIVNWITAESLSKLVINSTGHVLETEVVNVKLFDMKEKNFTSHYTKMKA